MSKFEIPECACEGCICRVERAPDCCRTHTIDGDSICKYARYNFDADLVCCANSIIRQEAANASETVQPAIPECASEGRICQEKNIPANCMTYSIDGDPVCKYAGFGMDGDYICHAPSCIRQGKSLN